MVTVGGASDVSFGESSPQDHKEIPRIKNRAPRKMFIEILFKKLIRYASVLNTSEVKK